LRAITTAFTSCGRSGSFDGIPLNNTVLRPPVIKKEAASLAPVKSSAMHPNRKEILVPPWNYIVKRFLSDVK
jgi:hypothetical protein